MTAGRLLWPDAARGACILLVVLWHVDTKHYVHVAPAAAADVWRFLDLLVQPVRVPLFFVVSGYLASRAVRLPWRDLLGGRVATGYWVHVVWLLLGSAFFAVGPPLVTRTAHSPGELLLALVVGYTNTWYVYALAAYAVVAKAATRVPLRVAVGAAAVLAVLADTRVAPTLGNSAGLMANLLFFLVPALRPELVDALVPRASRRSVVQAAAAYLPLAALAVATEVSRLAVVSTVLSVLGAVLGVLLAVHLAAVRPGALTRLARLGRRTLPVYVLHLPLLALLHAVVPPLPAALGAGYPLLAVGGLVAGCLLLHRLLLAARLGVLFRPPRRALVASGS